MPDNSNEMEVLEESGMDKGSGEPPPSKDKDAPKGAERRQAKRVDVSLDVDYAREDNFLMTRSASITNLSSLGIFICTDKPSPVDTTLTLRFQPPQAQRPIEVEGVVAWANKSDDDGPDADQNGMGIEFVNLDDETRQRLISLVKRIALLAED